MKSTHLRNVIVSLLSAGNELTSSVVPTKYKATFKNGAVSATSRIFEVKLVLSWTGVSVIRSRSSICKSGITSRNTSLFYKVNGCITSSSRSATYIGGENTPVINELDTYIISCPLTLLPNYQLPKLRYCFLASRSEIRFYASEHQGFVSTEWSYSYSTEM